MRFEDEDSLLDGNTDTANVRNLDAANVTATDTSIHSQNASSNSNNANETANGDTDSISDFRAPSPPTLSENGGGSCHSLRWFILEPAVFLIFFARYLIGAVYQNQVLYQTCVVIYHYNETQCQPLLGINRETEEAKLIETKVQPYVAKILMYNSLLDSIIPAFVSLFLGPWSDKFGRRPILLTTFSGYLFGAIILTIITFITTQTTINPWWFVLSSVPSVLSGGTCALITGIYCYISDVAKERKRALRMVLNEASICAGMMVGNVASGFIYAATDAFTLFSIATGLMLLALAFVFMFVPESIKPDQLQTGSRIREFFRIDLVKDLVRTCFQRRPNFDRAIIWLTMIALTIAIFTMEGEGNVNYLFLRKQFNWTIEEFSIFNAGRIVIQIVGSIFGMILLRRVLKFSIITMSMIALACCVLESVVRATAVYSWEMYLGMILGIMRGVMGPMCRAILSHVAPASEVGKIFALTTSLESVSPLIAAPLYTFVYNATLEYYPGAFNFISVGLYLLCYTLISAIFGIQKSLGDTVTYQAISS